MISYHVEWTDQTCETEGVEMSLGDFLFPHVELKLVIAHSFETDIESVTGKHSQEYVDIAARIDLGTGDMQKLGARDGGHISVKSKTGIIVVRAFESEKHTEGIATMPYGPWALALVDVPSDGSPPQMHGVTITLTRTDDEVTSLSGLLDS